MKKILLFIIICFAFIISGCSDRTINLQDISTVFNGIATLKLCDKTYECKISHTQGQTNVLEIVKPSELAGFTFSWEGGKQKITWNGLSCEVSKDFLPRGAMVEEFINALNSISEKKNLVFSSKTDEKIIFKGKTEFFDFQATFDKKGDLVSIAVPEINMNAEFFKS